MSTPKRSPRQRIVRVPVHGLLLLDKPLGLSSNDALQRAKWLLRAEKAGHTGTLDPLATGVLPLCFGAATKFSQLHLEANKSYEATLKLGQTTSTGDAEGELLTDQAVSVSEDTVRTIVASFVGEVDQTPPMYSALKHQGKPLYEYARAGIHVHRESRRVTVLSASVEAIFSSNPARVHANANFDAIKIVVSCSKGTYIRTLAEDIGRALGCGAHLTALRRIETGGFSQAQCITLAQLEAMSEAERLKSLQPVETLLDGAQNILLNNDNAGRFLSGMRRRVQYPDAALVAVFGDTPRALLGSAHIVAGELIPTRLLSPLEVSQALTQFSA